MPDQDDTSNDTVVANHRVKTTSGAAGHDNPTIAGSNTAQGDLEDLDLWTGPRSTIDAVFTELRADGGRTFVSE